MFDIVIFLQFILLKHADFDKYAVTLIHFFLEGPKSGAHTESAQINMIGIPIIKHGDADAGQ